MGGVGDLGGREGGNAAGWEGSPLWLEAPRLKGGKRGGLKLGKSKVAVDKRLSKKGGTTIFTSSQFQETGTSVPVRR